MRRAGIQAKLAVSQPDDPAEREADQVADRIMRMHGGAPAASTCSCAAGGDKCEECQQKQHATVARKAEDSHDMNDAPPLVANVLCSPGQPLALSARNSLEGNFGHDLSGVRVHHDVEAAESASAVNALAYTVGNHIVFGAGQYAPGTQHGDRLLAHEVTHTIQQGGALTGGIRRKVAKMDCPGSVFGAPADPRTSLETSDAKAVELTQQMVTDLAADSETVKVGMPAVPSASLQSYINHFGLPVAQGKGFLNRLTGLVRPSQEIALSEELSTVSRRFNLILRLLNGGLSYLCPGNRTISLVGCLPAACGTEDASSCPGNSLITLCASFWTANDETGRSQIIIHEGMHIVFPGVLDATTRGSGRNFNISGCYESLLEDRTGSPTSTCPPPA
jgi:hypothetical protein